MTRGKNSAGLRELLGQDQDLLRGLMQEALQQVLEMEEALGAGKSERSEALQGYRSGYYGRSLMRRVGKLELRVAQDRQGQFRTEVFARYQRSEKALVASLMEMYVQGVATRKVKAIAEELCGHEFGGVDGERHGAAVGRDAGEVRESAAGGGVPVPDAGRRW